MKDFEKNELILAEKPFAIGRDTSTILKGDTMTSTWEYEINSQKRLANAPDRVEMLNNILEMNMTPLETYKLSLLYTGKNGNKLKKMVPSMDVFRYDETTPKMKSKPPSPSPRSPSTCSTPHAAHSSQKQK